MKLKDSNAFDKNFCSFNWALLLKECGVRQDTVFHYVWDDKNDKYELTWDGFPYSEENIAAYTSQELIDLFPKKMKLSRDDNFWLLEHRGADYDLQNETKLVDVLARILITITKNKGQKRRLR